MLKPATSCSTTCAQKIQQHQPQNAKEICDTLVDMLEGTKLVMESMLDMLPSQLDKFEMKDGEGVTEM